eukprot:COSAG06_NODE_42351_length_382_cov_1.265018_1_plen_120_part_00
MGAVARVHTSNYPSALLEQHHHGDVGEHVRRQGLQAWPRQVGAWGRWFVHGGGRVICAPPPRRLASIVVARYGAWRLRHLVIVFQQVLDPLAVARLTPGAAVRMEDVDGKESYTVALGK